MRWMMVAVALAVPAAVSAQPLSVQIDAAAARAVLAAVRNPQLGEDAALAIARLPGNQGLIRKARSYGREASDLLFARALMAAARKDAGFVDVGQFDFDRVRDHAGPTEQALDQLLDPQSQRVAAVQARIAMFTPATVSGRVTGYLVVGGTSGGFAFGDPEFFLNLERFPSATLAATIMSHELFHAVQALAAARAQPSKDETACIKTMAHGEDVAALLDALVAEGTASLVGDVLALPRQGVDGATEKERAKFAGNVARVASSITQLELSIHGLATGAAVTADEVYELGFYGNEVLYGLGYVMARAIAAEQGNAAIGQLIGQAGSAFVLQYTRLQGYGKSPEMPALKPGTIAWAGKLSACTGPREQQRSPGQPKPPH